MISKVAAGFAMESAESTDSDESKGMPGWAYPVLGLGAAALVTGLYRAGRQIHAERTMRRAVPVVEEIKPDLKKARRLAREVVKAMRKGFDSTNLDMTAAQETLSQNLRKLRGI